jgi:hypothetical protein
VTLDLEDFAREHVCYEVKMLVGTYFLLSRSRDAIAHDGFLESFLLHARSLDAFLGTAVPEQDDVLARQYLDTWQPQHPLTWEQRRAVNQRLAHLTEDRVNQESVQVLALLAATVAGFGRFLAALAPESRLWFAEASTHLAAVPPALVARASTDQDDFNQVDGPE